MKKTNFAKESEQITTLKKLAAAYRQMPNGGAILQITTGGLGCYVADGMTIKAHFNDKRAAAMGLAEAGFWELRPNQWKLLPPAPVYTVEPGRNIYRNGKPFVSVTRQGDTLPTEADTFTRCIAAMLNQAISTPDALAALAETGEGREADCDPVDKLRSPYTYAQIASDYVLWGEYVDPSGLDSEAGFNEKSVPEKVAFMVSCFGAEKAGCL